LSFQALASLKFNIGSRKIVLAQWLQLLKIAASSSTASRNTNDDIIETTSAG